MPPRGVTPGEDITGKQKAPQDAENAGGSQTNPAAIGADALLTVRAEMAELRRAMADILGRLPPAPGPAGQAAVPPPPAGENNPQAELLRNLQQLLQEQQAPDDPGEAVTCLIPHRSDNPVPRSAAASDWPGLYHLGNDVTYTALSAQLGKAQQKEAAYLYPSASYSFDLASDLAAAARAAPTAPGGTIAVDPARLEAWAKYATALHHLLKQRLDLLQVWSLDPRNVALLAAVEQQVEGVTVGANVTTPAITAALQQVAKATMAQSAKLAAQAAAQQQQRPQRPRSQQQQQPQQHQQKPRAAGAPATNPPAHPNGPGKQPAAGAGAAT
jgi:hypothetical protein